MAIRNSAQTTERHYLDALAEFVAETTYEDLPEDIREHTRYVVLDTVGAVLAGSAEAENVALTRALASNQGAATILARGFPNATTGDAALANGTSGTAMEQDEGHPPVGHPAIYTLPAILALAEETNTSGRRLVEALVLAYDAYVRLGRSIRFVDGLHTHGSIATIAAAIGAARLRGFDARQTREAINVAACLNAATPFFTAIEGATVRNVYAGLAGRTGVLVAELVASGFTGPRDGLGEVYGWLLGHGIDPASVTAGLGDDYEIATNYFKLHAACRYTHAPLDAFTLALNGRQISADAIQSVAVTGNANAAMCSRQDPQNSLSAKFSVPFAIATNTVQGHTGPDAFRQPAIDDPSARALAARITVRENPAYTKRFPAEQVAVVAIHLSSGEVLTGEVSGPRGADRDPVSYAEVEAKFTMLAGGTFSKESLAAAQQLLKSVDSLASVRELATGLRSLSA